MSRASGWVKVEDQVVGYFIYDGTTDYAYTNIEASLDEAWAAATRIRNDQEEMRACTCGNQPIAVTLCHDYGSGDYWESEACLSCRAITGQRSSYPPYDESGWYCR